MKLFKKYIYTAAIAGTLFTGCADGLTDSNINPNEPEVVPSYTLMINAQKQLIEETRDEWFSGRMAQAWVQYWAQTNYTEEDRYQYRENSNNTAWKQIYQHLTDLQRIIELNVDPATRNEMSAYGNNDNQIAAARILKSWTFLLLADTYGPVPYHSHGDSENTNFQALQVTKYLSPKYAAQEDIYKDILKELQASAEDLAANENEVVFTKGDNIFNGDATKWKQFANSLTLRVGMRIRGVYPEASDFIDAAILSGVMQSTEDNALFVHGTESSTASPMYNAFQIDARADFAVANTFVQILKGERGPEANVVDPRLYVMASPHNAEIYGSDVEVVTKGAYLPGNDVVLGQTAPYTPDMYRGMPYGMGNSYTSKLGSSWPSAGNASLQATFGEAFMTYAETCFLLSEYNDWDQAFYEAGVRSSMERWGVLDQAAIEDYMSTLQDASEETVLTQKYIDNYCQPYNAWAEYRRTGYPNCLTMPGTITFEDEDDALGLNRDINDDGVVDEEEEKIENAPAKAYYFESLISDVQDDLPARTKFAQEEKLLNASGLEFGYDDLGGKGNDIQSTKLWWDIN